MRSSLLIFLLAYVLSSLPAEGATGDESWDDRFTFSEFYSTLLSAESTSQGELFVSGTPHILAKWNGRRWIHFNATLSNGLAGDVLSMAPAGTNLYVGGTFQFSRTGQALNCIALMRENGTYIPLSSGVNGPVHAVAVHSNEVFIGGSFTLAGGAPATNIARWNGSSWSGIGTGLGGLVRALSISADGTLYAGGSFTTAGSNTLLNLGRWNGSNWIAVGGGVNSAVHALQVNNEGLVVGGTFTLAGTSAVSRIAFWNGATWSSMGGGANDQVDALRQWNGHIYAAGSFTNMGGIQANRIARWNGSAWDLLDGGLAGAYNRVFALAVHQSRLVAAGDFLSAGDKNVNRIAAWDGSTWHALHRSLSYDVNALASDGTNIFAGGDFIYAGGKRANSVARWDGSEWQTLGIGSAVGFNAPVLALACGLNGSLYAGGNFTQAGTNGANRIARFDGSIWQPLQNGMEVNGSVNALAFLGTNLYAGGTFSTAGGVPARAIARWNGVEWSDVGGSFDPYSYVFSLAVIGNDLYAGGIFTSVAGMPATNIARWDGSRWWPLGGGISFLYSFPAVNALAVNGTDLYVGGKFSMAGQVPANRVAKWNGQTWSALGTGINNEVKALHYFGDALYAGGLFTAAGDLPVNYLARFEAGSWVPLGSGTSEENRFVHAILGVQSNLYVGGRFGRVGTNSSPFFGLWHPPRIPSEIRITSPSANQLFTSGNPIQIVAEVKPAISPIARVNFLRNGLIIGTRTNAPYAITVISELAGSFLLVAETIDELGVKSTSPALPIRVNPPPDNRPPTVFISAPSANSIFSVGQSIPLTAQAADPDGTILQVSFYEGDNLLGVATNSPFSIFWTNALRNSYQVRAIAMDNVGAVVTSSSLSIRIQEPPEINIQYPSANDRFVGPLTLTLSAEVRDWEGSVTNVLFYANDALLGRFTYLSSSQFYFVWSNAPLGNYSLTARAFDDLGGTTLSVPVPIVIETSNALPVIELISPVAGQSFTTPTNVLLSASAQDPDGSIREVRFYESSGLLGVVTNPPFEFLWENPSPGAACMWAIAVDNRGGSRRSETICIQVIADLTQAPRYALIDLGELTGSEGWAGGINAAGDVTGSARTPINSSSFPFIYRAGEMTFLDGYGQTGFGTAINDRSEIAGVLGQEAFFYANGQLTGLRHLGGSRSGARALNNAGQVVGDSDISGGGRRAFLYESNQLINLGTLGGESQASSINDAGVVVGWCNPPGIVLAFMYDRTNGMRQFNLPDGSSFQPKAINRNGAITGNRTTTDGFHRGFLLNGANLRTFGTLGGEYSFGVALNNLNQVVGYSINQFTETRAIIWTGGVMYDLNQLLHTNYGWVLTEALGINDRGQIAGWGKKGLAPERRAFLLTPLPRSQESNQPPSIRITAPQPGTSFFAAEDLAIKAAGFDPDGEIRRVQFFAGTNLLGTITNRPYQVTWSNLPAGNHLLTAQAIDLLGATGLSSSVNITVTGIDSNAPAVAVVAAARPQERLDMLAKIRNTRSFSRVDFYDVNRDMRLPTLSQLLTYDAIFVFSQDLFNNGIRLGDLLADYVDRGGGVVVAPFALVSFSGLEGRFLNGYLPWPKSFSTSGTALTLIPNLPRQHPILEGVNSFHGGSESYHQRPGGVSSNATLVASWSNGQPLVATLMVNTGRVVGLNLFPPSSDVQNGYWRTNTDGARLMANALLWAAAPSPEVSVVLIHPQAGGAFYPGQRINMEVVASSRSNSIQRVEFYRGTNLLGTDLTQPFVFAWTNAPDGNHMLSAVAFDWNGKSGISEVVSVVVESRMSVVLTSPLPGTEFNVPTNMHFAATVTNLDAQIVRVEFFAGPDRMGVDSNAPYAATWMNIGVGTYALTARAIDTRGTVKTSAPVMVVVVNQANPVDNFWIGGAENWFIPTLWSVRVPLIQDQAFINNGGTAQITDGVARARRVKVGSGQVSLSGGRLEVRDQVLLGSNEGSQGTFTLSGIGYLSTAELIVGLNGMGLFQQSGGTNHSTNLVIISEPSGSGLYELQAGLLHSFGQSLGRTRNGELRQTGGTNTIASHLLLGTSGGSGTGIYHLGGGRLSAPLQKVGYGGPGSFIQSGGENWVGSELQIGEFGQGNYAISNGLLAVHDLIIANGRLQIHSPLSQIIVSNRLIFDRFGRFEGAPGSSISLLGNTFDLLQYSGERPAGLSNLTLVLAGTNLTRLEVAGVTDRGFANNIVLGALQLGTNRASRSQLVDRRDNDASGFFGDETFFTYSLNWFPGSVLDLNGESLNVFNPVQLQGELIPANGTLSTPVLEVMGNGILRTGGWLEGNLINRGRISAGFLSRTLQVNGSYDQMPAPGTFEIQINGVGHDEFDRIVSTGEARLGGVLTVRLGGNFSPARALFPILRADRVIGRFAVENLPPPTNGVSWHVRYETNRVLVESVLSAQIRLSSVISTNSQSGLQEQRVRIENFGLLTTIAFRLLIHDLPAGVTVINAAGMENGVPFVSYPFPLAPGESITLVIEYDAPAGTTLNPRLEGLFTVPEAGPLPTGTVLSVTSTARQVDGSYLLTLETQTNATYYIQYSTDLLRWKSGLPPLVGTGQTVTWIDDGPPKTESFPTVQSHRFYRVLRVVED